MGVPWYRYPWGADGHLTKARRYKTTSAVKENGHSLEFILDLEDHQYQRLESMCMFLPVDHSQANTNRQKTCHRFNSRGVTCPFPWPKVQTREKMVRKYLHLSDFISLLEIFEAKDLVDSSK